MGSLKMWHEPDDAQVRDVLREGKTVAIVGVSDNPEKASHGVAKWLMAHTKYELYFVNPKLESLFGQPVYKSLADIPVAIDIVDVFRRGEDMPAVFEDAVKIKPKVFWMQLGIVNQDVAEKAVDAGMVAIQNRCIKIECAKYPELYS